MRELSSSGDSAKTEYDVIVVAADLAGQITVSAPTVSEAELEAVREAERTYPGRVFVAGHVEQAPAP